MNACEKNYDRFSRPTIALIFLTLITVTHSFVCAQGLTGTISGPLIEPMVGMPAYSIETAEVTKGPRGRNVLRITFRQTTPAAEGTSGIITLYVRYESENVAHRMDGVPVASSQGQRMIPLDPSLAKKMAEVGGELFFALPLVSTENGIDRITTFKLSSSFLFGDGSDRMNASAANADQKARGERWLTFRPKAREIPENFRELRAADRLPAGMSVRLEGTSDDQQLFFLGYGRGDRPVFYDLSIGQVSQVSSLDVLIDDGLLRKLTHETKRRDFQGDRDGRAWLVPEDPALPTLIPGSETLVPDGWQLVPQALLLASGTPVAAMRGYELQPAEVVSERDNDRISRLQRNQSDKLVKVRFENGREAEVDKPTVIIAKSNVDAIQNDQPPQAIPLPKSEDADVESGTPSTPSTPDKTASRSVLPSGDTEKGSTDVSRGVDDSSRERRRSDAATIPVPPGYVLATDALPLRSGIRVGVFNGKRFVPASVYDPQSDGQVKIQMLGANEPLAEPVARALLIVNQKIAERLESRLDDPHGVPRRWTDRSGRFAVTAYLESSSDNQVRLRKLDGSRITVPLDKLSDQDRKAAGGKSP